jgi:hypothetical protein
MRHAPCCGLNAGAWQSLAKASIDFSGSTVNFVNLFIGWRI